MEFLKRLNALEEKYYISFGKQFIFSPTKDGWKINSIKERLGEDEGWSKTYM